MATVRILNPRVATSVAATNLYELGDASPFLVSSMAITVSGSSSLSMTLRGAPSGTGVTTSSPQLGYIDASGTGTQTAGSTAITADGTYRVTCDGECVALHVTAGSASVTAVPLGG